MPQPISITGRAVHEGIAEGEALVSQTSIPGWGGLDVRTGRIIDPGSAIDGMHIVGKVLVLSGGRGSTGWGSQFLRTRIAGTNPAALLFPKMDARSAAASVVCRVPVVTDFDADIFALIQNGDWITVDGSRGIVTVQQKECLSTVQRVG